MLSIEQRTAAGRFQEPYTDNGREHTGLDVVDWVAEGVRRGAGEVLLTSVDHEGTRKGLDMELLRAVTSRVEVPVILSGGYAQPQELADAARDGASGVAIADALHWKRAGVQEIKAAAAVLGVEVRA